MNIKGVIWLIIMNIKGVLWLIIMNIKTLDYCNSRAHFPTENWGVLNINAGKLLRTMKQWHRLSGRRSGVNFPGLLWLCSVNLVHFHPDLLQSVAVWWWWWHGFHHLTWVWLITGSTGTANRRVWDKWFCHCPM